jgi:hypothetical protein
MKLLLILSLFAVSAYATVSSELVASYLDSLGASYEQDENAFLLYVAEEGEEHWPFFYLEISESDEACYMVAFTPGILPATGDARVAGLETLTELNWNYTFVKFLADPESGEVTVTYTFSTENGMGFDAFSVMMYVLIATVQENIEVLANL